MLTIDDIKNVSFRKAGLGGGYNADDVDSFVDEVIASFEQLKKEKTNLVHKIDVLATRVEQYRADEETVRNALLASQKVSDACIKEAKEKAAKIIREAETKAQSLVTDANKMTTYEKENYLSLQADAVALRNELIELYRNHIKSIDELPTAVDLEAKAKELDEKYPTEPIAEPVQAADALVEHVAAAQQEIVPEQEPQQVQASDNSAEVDEILSSMNKKGFKPAPKRGALKFGDNYDVSAE
ncbi:MAG: DivIVA domain-containing protein [Ruminococcus sp.]|nr:DivIVA domain-containing protein [Ruminococcus sp.]MEE0856214.1 DivIVA domain-containing protein [Ruminococcus sp.]MEE1172733.1 DivIVA domain-containing protein [Ruminococcus sp.]